MSTKSVISSIVRQFGNIDSSDKSSVNDLGNGQVLSSDWINFVKRSNPRYQKTLLDIWDLLVDAKNTPVEIRQKSLESLDKNTNIANAITFYGRRIKARLGENIQEENYLTGAQMALVISAERTKIEEDGKIKQCPLPWKRPKYGMGTRIDNDPLSASYKQKICWVGKLERFN
tara:strand:+ start:6583 stop:7101 length:519 start_codon:yes stop_codon:yes gene_type:complete